MFPSVFLFPVPMAALALCNRVCGPVRIMRLCENVSNRILNIVNKPQLIRYNDVSFELSCVMRLMPKPYVACLELACTLQIWLAMHGDRARVVIGRRVENGRILMHAWVETINASFFADERFVPVSIAL